MYDGTGVKEFGSEAPVFIEYMFLQAQNYMKWFKNKILSKEDSKIIFYATAQNYC